MPSREEFAAECREVSRDMRRLPAEVKAALRARSKAEVAEPMAADIRTGGRSVYARRVAPMAKVRSNADPTIVVGGARRVASGGASTRDLVFGAVFGGQNRVSAVPARAGRKAHRRHSTRQFAGERDPFMYRTVFANVDRYLERWGDIIETEVRKVLNNGQ